VVVGGPRGRPAAEAQFVRLHVHILLRGPMLNECKLPDDISPDLAREFTYWCDQLDPELPDAEFVVSAGDVLRAHFTLAEFFRQRGEGIGGVGPRGVHLLQSAVSRQFVSLGTVRKWTQLCEVAATLFFGLIRDHPFHDANKRTALLTLLYQLQEFGRTPTVRQKDLEQLTLRTAEHRLKEYSAYERFARKRDAEVQYLAYYFKRYSRELDKRNYLITYRELDAILRRYDARLVVADGNRVDVLRTTMDYSGIVAFHKKPVEKRVAQLVMHDWGAQVPLTSIKHLRHELGLTPAKGVDSMAFFQGVDPLKSLVREYAGPLERLADR